MGRLRAQYLAERRPFDKLELLSSVAAVMDYLDCLDYPEGSAKSRSIGGEVQLQPINILDFSTGLFSQRLGSRKDNMERYTLKVHLPQNAKLGGLEGPLDDGFSWRKYGQKVILGSKYPRYYYRCIHRLSNGCYASKQIHRMDDDPNEFEVTYRGSHTCHKSSTVPSIGSLPSSVSDQKSSDVTQLSTDSLGRSFMTVGSGSSGVDLSTAQKGKEVENPVPDMADEMHYSDNSSCSSMDFPF